MSLFLMRADNQGEGGVLALTALARRALGRRSMIALVLGAAGAALFYGDAIITPALSVLSAVEGLRTIPGAGTLIGEHTILFLTIAILIALFLIQARGTAHVSQPVRAGLHPVVPDDRRHGAVAYLGRALDPAAWRRHWYGIEFLVTHGVTGLFVLGAVFLTVTGCRGSDRRYGPFRRRADPPRLVRTGLPRADAQLSRPGRLRAQCAGDGVVAITSPSPIRTGSS